MNVCTRNEAMQSSKPKFGFVKNLVFKKDREEYMIALHCRPQPSIDKKVLDIEVLGVCSSLYAKTIENSCLLKCCSKHIDDVLLIYSPPRHSLRPNHFLMAGLYWRAVSPRY